MNPFRFLFSLTVLCLVVPVPEVRAESSQPSTLDYSRLKLVWSDEFDGTSLDSTKWDVPNKEPRHGGSVWMADQVSVSDGILRLGISLITDPTNSYKCGAVRTRARYTTDLFSQTYGYFEARCQLPKNVGADYWAAFWMMAGRVTDDEPSTRNGSEIDIMESFTFDREAAHQLTLHWNGYGKKHNSWSLPCGNHPQLLDGEYHTFGLYWDKKKYISFVDGVEVGRTDFLNKGSDKDGKVPSKGPCRKPGYIKLSCEASTWAGGAGWEDPLPTSDEFLVDYVRVYRGRLR
ncbi:MAG TPA: glycoside hydrolase family 16 protein [bacterium]|nr:glycoside hydrolase family 16 protein [bacterium]